METIEIIGSLIVLIATIRLMMVPLSKKTHEQIMTDAQGGPQDPTTKAQFFFGQGDDIARSNAVTDADFKALTKYSWDLGEAHFVRETGDAGGSGSTMHGPGVAKKKRETPSRLASRRNGAGSAGRGAKREKRDAGGNGDKVHGSGFGRRVNFQSECLSISEATEKIRRLKRSNTGGGT